MADITTTIIYAIVHIGKPREKMVGFLTQEEARDCVLEINRDYLGNPYEVVELELIHRGGILGST